MSVQEEPRLLILDTADRPGLAALACGEQLRGVRILDDARRNGRDLAPAVAELLQEQGWQPRSLQAVLVSQGPGSYTGLRVGIISAKVLAYATGCKLVPIDTFHAIAEGVEADVGLLDVIADAQQEKIYVQPFQTTGTGWQPQHELAIRSFADWLSTRDPQARVIGPGLRKWQGHLPAGAAIMDSSRWSPRPESLLKLGLRSYRQGEHASLWQLEPLYLRPSSAEEQWQKRG